MAVTTTRRPFRTRPLLGSALLASTMLAGVPAFAQTTTSTTAQTNPSANAQAGSGTLETITVTAEKHSENLQKVPMNVQALTNERLNELHATDFTTFVQYLPSVQYTIGGAGGGNGAPGFYNVSMRGVNSGNDGNHSGPLPTVGFYLDEQPITTIGGTLDIPTYDVSRVEALSGPQGTLYGASSEAGTIRIITNKPDPSAFEASYSIEGNSVEHGGMGYKLNGMVNLPINDEMAIRIVAWDEHDAGFIDNTANTRVFPAASAQAGHTISINNDSLAKSNFNTVNKMGARAALGIDLNSNWTITPSLMGEVERTDGLFSYDPAVGFLQVHQYFPDYTHDTWYQSALTVQGKISDLDFVYAGSYMDRWIHGSSDYTDYTFWYDKLGGYYFTNNAGQAVQSAQHILSTDQFTKLSNEVRLSSSASDRFHWVIGGFQETQTHWILQNYQLENLGSDFWVTGWPHTLWLTDQHRTDRDLAAFAQATFAITPSLSLTGGIRFFNAHNTLAGFFGFSSAISSHTGEAACFAPSNFHRAPCTNLNQGVKESGETHKVNLTWQIDDDHMIYATYSTGFRPGGVNRVAILPPYQSDTLTNYEAGWKTSWDSDRIHFNGDVFLENWQDFQFAFLGINSLTQISNAPNAQIKGLESDFQWLVGDHLTLSGAGAYVDAHLTQNFCGVSDPVTGKLITTCPGPADPLPPQAAAGDPLPITPKWKLNATARYEFDWGDYNPFMQGVVVYQSGAWPDMRDGAPSPLTQLQTPIRTLLGKMPGYAAFNLSAGFSHDNWSVELAAQNLFDSRGQLYRYAQCTTQVCGFQPYIVPTTPRLISLSFSQKF